MRNNAPAPHRCAAYQSERVNQRPTLPLTQDIIYLGPGGGRGKAGSSHVHLWKSCAQDKGVLMPSQAACTLFLLQHLALLNDNDLRSTCGFLGGWGLSSKAQLQPAHLAHWDSSALPTPSEPESAFQTQIAHSTPLLKTLPRKVQTHKKK